MKVITKFDGCINRFSFQLEKIIKHSKILFTIVFPTIKDKEASHFFLENIIIRTVSVIEEYLKSLLFVAAFHRRERIIEYIKNSGDNSLLDKIESGRIDALSAAISKELSFKKDAKKLKRIFHILFDGQLFPNSEVENSILDLILVRNIIVHEGGSPKEKHVSKIRTPGVIIIFSELKLIKSKLYKLEILENNFFLNTLKSIQALMIHINEIIKKNPDFIKIMNIKKM
jgi:hypothetical protein